MPQWPHKYPVFMQDIFSLHRWKAETINISTYKSANEVGWICLKKSDGQHLFEVRQMTERSIAVPLLSTNLWAPLHTVCFKKA